jgi:uracil-DNA glycosylase
MTRRDIARFLAGLALRHHSERVTNPYRLPHRSGNLGVYLEQVVARPGRRMLLVGEAPGYRGALLTGIPFSSEQVLDSAGHPFLRHLRPGLVLEGHSSEATATLLWDYLAHRRTVPLCWNAFPFHPHQPRCSTSNRAPLAQEIREGQSYLRAIGELYQPQLIAGLGATGSRAARSAFPGQPVYRIRHPSHGGKSGFVAGMDALFRRRLPAAGSNAGEIVDLP